MDNALDYGEFDLFFKGWKKQINIDDAEENKSSPLFYEKLAKLICIIL